MPVKYYTLIMSLTTNKLVQDCIAPIIHLPNIFIYLLLHIQLLCMQYLVILIVATKTVPIFINQSRLKQL